MFSRLFGRSRPFVVPSGYPAWDVEGFQQRFEITANQAGLVRAAYLAVLASDQGNELARVVIQNAGDMQQIVAALKKHADVHGNAASRVGIWFVRLTGTRSSQLRMLNGGITEAEWISLSCGHAKTPLSSSHQDRDGQLFSIKTGFATNSGYEMPSTAFDCGCRFKPLLNFDEDS